MTTTVQAVTRDDNTTGDTGIGVRLAGKYMAFKLAEEEYGLEILRVREIIGLMDITRVPRAAPYMRGVINLRGRVIPVIDLRLKFGMEPAPPTDQTVIIVVQVPHANEDLTIGVLVDEVLEVRNIACDQIAPPPDVGVLCNDGDFIVGVAKTERRVIFLLDIERALRGVNGSNTVD
jgi:purine-binding chemotaxis protein CheW